MHFYETKNSNYSLITWLTFIFYCPLCCSCSIESTPQLCKTLDTTVAQVAYVSHPDAFPQRWRKISHSFWPFIPESDKFNRFRTFRPIDWEQLPHALKDRNRAHRVWNYLMNCHHCAKVCEIGKCTMYGHAMKAASFSIPVARIQKLLAIGPEEGGNSQWMHIKSVEGVPLKVSTCWAWARWTQLTHWVVRWSAKSARESYSRVPVLFWNALHQSAILALTHKRRERAPALCTFHILYVRARSSLRCTQL